MLRKGIKHIVVIGGGTGTHTILSGLKKYPKEDIKLSAIISVSDSGGSTGRLRDEFGVLPVGDFRMALVALAEDGRSNNLLRELFLYRFEKGEGLSGHNFGNLLLVAMTDILGSEEKAIAFASRVLRVRGDVIPITTNNVTLNAEYSDGSTLEGESAIDSPPEGHDGTKRIEKLWISPEGQIGDRAERAIKEADLIVLGPGDLYTSILSNIVVSGTADALQNSKAKIAYVVNLMTKYGQTHDYTASDHINDIVKYAGRAPEYVLINNSKLPPEILETYRLQNEFIVENDIKNNNLYSVIQNDFLSPEKIKHPSGDIVKRSLIRHNPDTIAEALIALL